MLALATPLCLLRGTNLTPLDLAESDSSIELVLANHRRSSFASLARTRASLVKPRHIVALVPPDTESKNHTSRHSLAHPLRRAEIHIPRSAMAGTVLIIHVVDTRNTVLLYRGVLDLLRVLDVKPTVLNQVPFGIGRELCDDGERSRSIDNLLVAVVVRVADRVRVVAAAVLVANAVKLAFRASA